jgi:hypothetical protein
VVVLAELDLVHQVDLVELVQFLVALEIFLLQMVGLDVVRELVAVLPVVFMELAVLLHKLLLLAPMAAVVVDLVVEIVIHNSVVVAPYTQAAPLVLLVPVALVVVVPVALGRGLLILM